MYGSQNFKIDSVLSHKASTGHTHCVAAAKVTENPQPALLPHASSVVIVKTSLSEDGKIV